MLKRGVMLTAIVRDWKYLNHKLSNLHPESHKRLETIYWMLDNDEDMKKKFFFLKPHLANIDEISQIHSINYINNVKYISKNITKLSTYYLNSDTEICCDSYEIALLAAGGVCNAIDLVINSSNKINNAFCLIRPPGHHAEYNQAAGFCLFNNIAIGAMYAIRKYNLKKILIVDWDLHHGNGTQNTFYNDSRIMYFSTHQSQLYPGTGDLQEIGQKDGLGYTINIPLNPKMGNSEYIKIFIKILKPLTLEYKPELILLSAGFDIHYQDNMGGMNVTEEGFSYLTQILMYLAKLVCNNRLIVVLEGGYHLEALKKSVKTVLNQMSSSNILSIPKTIEYIATKNNPLIDDTIKNSLNILKPYWNNLEYYNFNL